MGSFSDFKEMVKKKGLGTAEYGNVNGTPVLLSRGVREEFLAEDKVNQIIALVTKFQKGDFGTAEEFGKAGKPGHEYGRYAIAEFDETEEDTAVWVHRAEDSIIVYFAFER